MNAQDFCTGQLFDWFIASDTAFALIERLPTAVTANVGNPDCPDATEVGTDKMYTQIVREVPVRPDAWHHVDIALTRLDGELWVDYFLDREHIAHVADVGIPLDSRVSRSPASTPPLVLESGSLSGSSRCASATACSRCWTRSRSNTPELLS